MFQAVAIIALLGTLIGVVVHWVKYPVTTGCRGAGGVIRGLVHIFSLLLIEQRLSLLGALKKLCYIVAVICFVLLGLTGFWPLLARGEHISGYLMMLHATLAPIFAICLAILTLTWARRYRFELADCPLLGRLLRRFTRLNLPIQEQGPCRCAETMQKAAFWAIVVLSLPLIGSIALSMLPLFGTHWQELLLAAHRWTAVAFAVAVIVHTYLAVRIRIAW